MTNDRAAEFGRYSGQSAASRHPWRQNFRDRWRPLKRWMSIKFAALLTLVAVGMSAQPAYAVPAFADQTGQSCQSCHVGGFGPQLTAFGREFKLRGYTMRTDAFNVPISAMAVASYARSKTDQASAPAPGLHRNDNLTLDQVSLFVAGGLGQHLGAFVQTTYDGIAKTFSWDNLDLRAVTTTQIKGQDVLLGVSLNNSPAVQDVWNTMPAWGYPYTSSAVTPSPAAAPLLGGALAQTSLGMTGYAWINSEFFVEAGGYGSPSHHDLSHLGADPFAPGDIKGWAPYARLALQKTVGPGALELGAFGMRADIHPARDRTTGSTDQYTDLGVDGSYLITRANGDVVTLNGRYIHERQSMDATCALDGAGPDCARNSLDDIHLDGSYYWRDKIGATLALFDTRGSANPVLYVDNRSPRPNSSGVSLQLDGTPFGDGSSPFGTHLNMRVGVQYTAFTRFNGAGRNYDNAGANASDNNTLRVFTWFAF